VELVYDSGALIAAERGDVEFAVFNRTMTRAGILPRVLTTVLAQVWRGGPRQALLSIMLRSCNIVPLDEDTARLAGVLCDRAGTSDIVDAGVVILAVQHRANIATSDRGDITKLLDSLDPQPVPRPLIFDV
jgi:predicted nucleic acid-binding protein